MTSKQDFSTTPLKPAEPHAGYEVFTFDGLPVGTVSKISDGFMRIDAQLRPDFWLRLDDATNVEGRAITLAYPREALEQHKHSGPAPSSDDLMPTGADPVLLDEAEQLAQRELMERELEEQRWRRAQQASAAARGDWQHEQRAGAGITGRVILAAAVTAGMAMIVLGVRMLRRRRRHEPTSEPTIP